MSANISPAEDRARPLSTPRGVSREPKGRGAGVNINKKETTNAPTAKASPKNPNSDQKKVGKDDKGQEKLGNTKGKNSDPTQKCEACGEEQHELHFCIHCANSVCFKCRSKHIEVQVQEFVKSREETTTNQRAVNKLIHKLTDESEELSRNEARCLDAIEHDFRLIEKALNNRKTVLKKEVKSKYGQQLKPLQNQKRSLEKEFANINSKYENIVRNISLPPSSASLGTYGKIKNPEFALLCGSTLKCGECNSSFGELRSKCEEASQNVCVLEFNSGQSMDEILEKVKGHGEVKLVEKESKKEEDGKESEEREWDDGERGESAYEADAEAGYSMESDSRNQTAVSRD